MNEPAPATRFFEHRSDFRCAVLDAIGLAESELLMFDPTYLDWQANSPELAAALTAFLGRTTRAEIRMVITEIDRIHRDYPRLAEVLRVHAHRIQCRVTPETLADLNETMLVIDRASALRRPVASVARGVLRVLDAEYASTQVDRFNELWEACRDRYSPTTLGL